MKISEIYSAMGLKIKLNYEDTSADFREGNLIRVEASHEARSYLVSQYGKGVTNNRTILCKVSPDTDDYLADLFSGEHENAYRCMFLITDVETGSLAVQTYTFRSVTEYKTPISIIVTDKLLEEYRYLSFVEIPYPKNVVAEAKAIIAAAFAATSDDDYVDPIVKKLESQRITPEAFEDDGERNARRLAAHIRINDDLGIAEDILLAIEAVCDEDYSSEDFSEYVKAVDMLRKRFCKDKVTIDPKDKDTINECILKLANTFSKHYLGTLSSMESKKSLILSNFLNRLEQDYEMIVQKYSMTTAATCQASMDLREGVDKTYDLVIIDEAARANPLDLFIPMSMGRKIILVGDHKQLPHMLEPDVLKLLTDDPKFKDIPEIEKSLFERLFEMFSKGQKPKAIPLTKQFRMHPEICSFVSDSFYDGILQTAKSVTANDRKSSSDINNGKALTFVNIPISRGAEASGVSKTRWAEVEVIGKDIRHILDVDPDASIGIIIIERLDALDAVLMEKFDLSFGNRIVTQTINFVGVFTAAGGTLEEALDYQISTKILRKVINSDDEEALLELLDAVSDYPETTRLLEKRLKGLR